MGTSLAKECTVVHLTTAKHDALVVVPVNAFSIPNRAAPMFELLYSARCDPYVRHWFGSPSGLEVQAERTVALTPPLPSDEFYTSVTSAFGDSTSQWMILRLTDDFTSALSSAYVPLSLLINHVKANQARTSAAAYFALGQSTMLRQGVQTVDFFMTRALCNDAKSGVLFQLVALQCQRYVEHLSGPTTSTAPKLPLLLYVRQGNLPVIRMLQKLYAMHIAPVAAGGMEDVQVSQIQPGWLRVFVDDGRLIEALRWRLASTIQMVVGSDASSRLVLFTDRHRLEMRTPFDLAVERAVPIWDQERRPVVTEAKIAASSQSVVVGVPVGDVAPRVGLAGPLPIGVPHGSGAGPAVHPRYRNPGDLGQGGRVPNQHPLRNYASGMVRQDPPRTDGPGTASGGGTPHTPTTSAEFWDNTPDVTESIGSGGGGGESKHHRYSSAGTATSFTSERTREVGAEESDEESSPETEVNGTATTAVTNADGPQEGSLDPTTIPPFTPAQIWREGGWVSYWFSPDTYPKGKRLTGRLTLTDQQPYKGAVLMRGSGEFKFLDSTGASVNIRSSGQKSAFFLSVPSDAFGQSQPPGGD